MTEGVSSPGYFDWGTPGEWHFFDEADRALLVSMFGQDIPVFAGLCSRPCTVCGKVTGHGIASLDDPDCKCLDCGSIRSREWTP